MPGLYERIIRPTPATVLDPIAGHLVEAVIVQFERGKITSAEGQQIIASVSGPLDAAGVTEFTTLIGTITGSAQARLSRSLEVFAALQLAQLGAPGYNTIAGLKAKIGGV